MQYKTKTYNYSPNKSGLELFSRNVSNSNKILNYKHNNLYKFHNLLNSENIEVRYTHSDSKSKNNIYLIHIKKPIIWADSFSRKTSNRTTLVLCYF